MGSSQTMLSLMTLMIMSVWITSANGLSQQGCGKSAANIRVRIAGGKHSRLGMWPWQVSIHKQSVFDSARYNIMCGGTLIAPQWVLTAAHCFYERRTSSSKVWFEEDTTSLKKYKIVAGEINTQIRETSEQERFPTEVYIHPGYRHDPYYENDIALVKLNQTVTLSSLVRTSCLPISNVDLAKPGTVGTVAGWGKTKKSRISTVLLHTTLEIQNNTVCDQATHYFFNRTVTFCAGDAKGNRDSCNGDSGGSLVRNLVIDGQNRWVAVGLVSWGVGCGLKGNFGYYTRIHPFVNWIKDTVKYSASSCANPGNILYGQLIGDHQKKRFANGTRIIYKCIDGYVLKGKSGRKCKGEEKWTSPPVCVRERPCPVVRHPHNGVGRPSRGSYRYKAKIQFYCNRNHVMMGRSSITCQIDGKWNGYPPLCLAIGCGRPKPVPHASFTGTTFTYRSRIKYTCDKGYKMKGNKWRTCKRNGKWTRKPRCVILQCKMNRGLHIPHGTVTTTDPEYKSGTTLSFRCNNGYKIVGDDTVECVDGVWSSKCTPYCQAKFIQSMARKPENQTFMVDPDLRTSAINPNHAGGQDIVFIFDGSSSIKKADFKLGIRFAHELVELLGATWRPGNIHVAALTYGTSPNLEFNLGDASADTAAKVMRKLGKIRSSGGDCETALRLVFDMVIRTVVPYTRPKSQKTLFLFTDGRFNFRDRPRMSAAHLRDKEGFGIYAVGVGNKLRRWGLMSIASEPEHEHVLVVEKYEHLLRAVKSAVNFKIDYSPCGVSPTSFRARMVGGNKAGWGTWPWQVGIYKWNWEGNLMLICGGALINRQWVLTVAHCFYGQNEFTNKREQQVIPSNQYTIKVGDDHLRVREPAQVDLDADSIYIHQNYKDHPKYENDIALVKLPKKVKLGPFVRTVCLPKKGEDLIVAGRHGYVAGWGVTQVLRPGQDPLNNRNSKYLQHSAFSIQSGSTCAKTPFNYNNNVTFCAGSGMGGNDTCQGDSGGSFVRQALIEGEHRWVSAGLVSWGLVCGLKGEYKYYTRVEPFVDWIKKTIQDN